MTIITARLKAKTYLHDRKVANLGLLHVLKNGRKKLFLTFFVFNTFCKVRLLKF